MAGDERTISDEELAKFVGELNMLLPDWCGWRLVEARKEHTDEHGVKIEPHECYYTRPYNTAYNCVLKYSLLSMERHIIAIFWGNQGLDESLQKVVAERQQKMIDAVQSTMSKRFGGLAPGAK